MLSRTRKPPWLIAAVSVAAALMLWVGYTVLWPFVQYSSSAQRTAASYLDEIEVDGYTMTKELTDSDFAVARYYVGPAGDPFTLVRAPGITLTPRPPDQQTKTDFDQILADSALPADWPHCGLTLLQQLNPLQADLSERDLARFRSGELEIILISVGCEG
ncbi:hypothetical protein ACFQZ4_34685 [Catellatospora coxensis]|uniref:hypothetical protein n=1 Tax=Catellatospora coxensis TaxID=310354 RepID=UPI0019451361|nr:hypothetical protein [Catellatospora coxensis]